MTADEISKVIDSAAWAVAGVIFVFFFVREMFK